MNEALAPTELARRLVVGLAGTWPTASESAWLERFQPAGVLLFARNVTGPNALRALCAELRARLPRGAEIMADHEGGPVSALRAALGEPPSARSLGEVDDPDLTRRVHAATAARLRAAGIDRVLAPCADVQIEPRDPIIGVRAFAGRVEVVARHVASAVRGLREEGMRVCLKHWPGHGGAAADSHAGPAAAGYGAITEPFLAGIAAGADAVMVGHLLTSLREGAGRDDRGLPATLDPLAVRDLRAAAVKARARRESRLVADAPRLLVFADDVTMGALRPAMAARGIRPASPTDGESRADWEGRPRNAGDAAAIGAAITPAGLVDPAVLPLRWLAALVEVGHDRLLCRGIPWHALPLATHLAETLAGPSAAQPPQDQAESGDAPEAPPAVYTETWRRLARVSGGDPFPQTSGRLLWLDGTAGDRWGEAAPRLSALLARRFATIDLVPFTESGAHHSLPSSAEPRFASVLVTAHRPQPGLRTALGAIACSLEPAGGCLALGHPCLAAELRGALPPAWRLAWLPEMERDAVAAVC